MRSDKYKNREIKTSLPKDSWEETQLLFKDRDRQREAMKRRGEYQDRRQGRDEYQEYLEQRRAANPDRYREGYREPQHRSDLDTQNYRVVKKTTDDAYQEYLEMRKNPDGNRSPEYDRGRHVAAHNSDFERDRQAARRKMENDAYAKERIKKQQPILAHEPDRYEKKEERKSRVKRQREAEEYNLRAKSERKARKKNHKKRFGGRFDGDGGGRGGRIGKICSMVLLIAAVLVVGLFLLVNAKLARVTNVDLDKSALGIDPRVAEELKDYRNIVLLGVDARDMSDYDNCRTDAIIIMSIDKKNDEIRQISVYRDTFMYTDEKYGYNKITNVHANGGNEATIRTLNKNMDLNIEEFAIINWKVVADMVDGLGGIEIDVQESEIDELNKYALDTQANIGGSTDLVEAPGLQTLNGNQAVSYTRIRKDSAQGDYRRNERMKIMLSAVIEKSKHTNPIKLNKVANDILPQIHTNMNNVDMMMVMMAVMTGDMNGSTGWPFTVTGWSSGAWYGVPHTLQTNVTQLHEQYFNQPGYVPTETVQEISKNISYKTGIY